MTQEDKQELLRDLCARLPYHPQCYCKWTEKAPNGTDGCVQELSTLVIDEIEIMDDPQFKCQLCDVKLYLRPMSSMTEEENIERKKLGILLAFGDNHKTIFSGFGALSGEDIIKCFDWLNAHHFDFRNLISKGLAIEAPDGMYNLNEK